MEVLSKPEPAVATPNPKPAAEAADESQYSVVTRDGWELSVTRYRRKAGPTSSAAAGEPLLLIHGFSQNRSAWTAGELVGSLIREGVDVHLGELRGHGQSSMAHQRERHQATGSALPVDLEHGWDLDAHLLDDLPALVEGVKRVAGRDRIFYGGHSLGGVLGYAYASGHDDLEGLITFGAAVDPGKDSWLVWLAAQLEPSIAKGIDGAFGLTNWARRRGRSAASDTDSAPLRYAYLPMDAFLQAYGRLLVSKGAHELYGRLCARAQSLVLLSNPSQVVRESVAGLLQGGGEKEPRRVTQQLAEWVRTGRLTFDRAGVDLRAALPRIRVPTLVLYGQADKLANRLGTAPIVREVSSEYRRWVGLPAHGHLELTMGLEVEAIAGHILELVAYARTHRVAHPG